MLLDDIPIAHLPIFQNPLDKPRGILVDIELGRIEVPKQIWAKAVQLIRVFHDYSTTTR